MKPWALIGTGILTMGALAGVTWAGDASKADMDFCNQKAAEGSTPNSVPPGARTEPAPSGVPSSGTTGTPVSPGTTQPGAASPATRGMAPVGETDSKYRQAYLACLKERTK